jgi:hypothetical protein
MRRFICGLIASCLLIAARPGQLTAEANCSWIEIGRSETYFYDGTVYVRIYYKYFCDGQPAF